MTSMRDKFVNLLVRQIGVAESPFGSNKQKFSRWFDVEAWQYFNTKKNPSEWCSQLLIWAVAQNEILGKEESRKFLGLPAPKNNCAAGCSFFWNYLVAKGYKVDKTKGIKGDIIFFNTTKAKCGHVGAIRREDSKYYYTIEGNKGNKVAEGKYLKTSSSIYGVCHLPWEKYDKEETPVVSAPDVTATIKPVEPAIKYCRVKTITGAALTLRSGASTSSKALASMPNNSTLIYKGEVKGTWVYGSNKWACVIYKGKTGYCTATRIKKI